MATLIFDTNIWLEFIAQDKPKGILEELKTKKEEGEIRLLTNQIIIDEWERNKDSIKDKIKNTVDNYFYNAKKAFELYQPADKEEFDNQANAFFDAKDQLVENALNHVEETEAFLHGCEKTVITEEMKLEVIDRALEKRAPFVVNKNNVGDALILLSSIEYMKEKTIGIKDSIFVSYNHTDFASKEDKDKIDAELKDLIEEANMKYTRHIGEALELNPELNKEINEYFEYLEQSADDWIQTQIDIARGK